MSSGQASRWPQKVVIGTSLAFVIANALFFLAGGSYLFMLHTIESNGIVASLGDTLLSVGFWVSEHGLESVVYVSCVFMFLCMLVASQVALITGVRRLRTRSNRRNGFAFVVVGTALVSYAAVLPMTLTWWQGEVINSIRERGQDITLASRELLDSNRLSPEMQQRFWKTHAQNAYIETGEQIWVPQPDGQKLQYEPSPADIESRENMLKALIRPKLPYGAIWVWAILGLIGILVGLVTPNKQAAQNASPSAAPHAT